MMALEEALMRQGEPRERGRGGICLDFWSSWSWGPSWFPASMEGKIGSGSARIGSSGVVRA